MSDFNAFNKKISISEVQPDYASGDPPKRIRKTGRRNNVLYVAGEGPMESGVMVITQALEEAEAAEAQGTNYGLTVRQAARYLKGDFGTVLKDCALSSGIDFENVYYTGFIKWLLPRSERNKPKREALDWALPALLDEIDEMKPRVIICLGKLPFDALVELKINATDALGGWFWSERAQARVFLMEKPSIIMVRPERLEQFRLLFREASRMLDSAERTEAVPREYEVVRSRVELENLVGRLRAGRYTRLAVDCEWGGVSFIDGRLRSLQICWAPGKVAYVRFMDDQGNYDLDCTYREAGGILSEWLDDPEVKYYGHQISADLPWMHHCLGLQWYNKCAMDTSYAMQTCDENAPMGLEWLALCCTDLGRYDLPLVLWKKANPQKEEDGYAYIPDDILIEYASCDSDVTYRGALWLEGKLRNEGVLEYYNSMFLPFVSNVFTSFSLHGMPMDRARMDSLRDVYNFSYQELLTEFREKLVEESRKLLLQQCVKLYGPAGASMSAGLFAGSKPFNDEYPAPLALVPFLEHFENAPVFNPNSKPQMVRWIFGVKGYQPVKSTDQKAKGIRSMPWEKVMELPPEKRADYTPALDKQTLKILSEQDVLIMEIFDLSVVRNICNSMLKEPTVDGDTGEVTKENGLHYWICSDNRIHPNFSTTETGRPRCWKPNVLNWPSFVTKQIAETIGKLFIRLHERGRLPDRFHKYVPAAGKTAATIPSIRSCVQAPEGWCIVESDLRTAEVRGLGFISGDKNLIRLLTEPDESFGLVAYDGANVPVRLFYRDAYESGIPLEAQDARLLMGAWKNNEKLLSVTEDMLLRDKKGGLRHPSHDLHWSLAEMLYHMPREIMYDKLHRSVGKCGNFKTAYGTSPVTLERGIEADTGVKPEPGTGQAVLDVLKHRQPDAVRYLEELEILPREKGVYVAASGRKRRFYKHSALVGDRDNWKLIKSVYAALGREARNFPMQESVAATAQRAGNWLLAFERENSLQGYQIEILYDSVVTLCPIEERWIWERAHELYIHLKNSWRYAGRLLRYPIDTDFNTGWSEKPPKDVRRLWETETYKPAPGNLILAHQKLKGLCMQLEHAT